MAMVAMAMGGPRAHLMDILGPIMALLARNGQILGLTQGSGKPGPMLLGGWEGPLGDKA